MGIPVLGGPGGIVQAGSIYNKCVVVLPVPYRISVVGRINRICSRSAHIGRQRTPVRPDFAPDINIFEQYEGAVRQRGDRHSANFVRHVLGKSKWIAISGMRIVRAGGTIFADGLILSVQLLPPRGETRSGGSLRIRASRNSRARSPSCPSPRQIPLRRPAAV